MKNLSAIKHTVLTLQYVRKKTNSVILFYSGGKDSVVLLDMLSSLFSKVVCVFMYFIKDLEHQKALLKYPELKYNNLEIIQYPHWMLSHYYRHSYYKFHRTDLENKTPLLKLGDIEQKAREETGIEWIVNGAKQSDGLNRNLMLGTLLFNSINEKSKRVYPLALWKKKDVYSYLKNKRIIPPTGYGINRSNGMDLSLDVLLFLKSNWPMDYNKVLEQFPFAEKIIFDYEYKQNHETSEV